MITQVMALEIMQNRPFRTLQDLDRVAGLESLAKELRLAGGYSVRTDHFSVRVSATINEVTKNASAVLRQSGTTGDTKVVYFHME